MGTGPRPPTLIPATHLEGDEQVDGLPDFADESLAQVAGESDLGLLCGHKPQEGQRWAWDPRERDAETVAMRLQGGGT